MASDRDFGSDAAGSTDLREAGKEAVTRGARTAYEDNENIRNLPNHLKQFIMDQRYDSYTPIDHAVWRYVMRQNYAFLKDNAHAAYIDGLAKTGIGIERLPSIEQMNEILAEIGWAAVTVDGFIPPAAFMEFQAHRVLVIAADVRQIDHIEYTPAPDIIHEAAGHAPIIADSQYAEYLRRFGEYGSKAISSRKDFGLYEAIRHLSILKESTNADANEVERAERDVEHKQKNLGEPSEMALLSRLHWWTVEYGLIGEIEDPKIYGAGLLSSIGESSSCLTGEVSKLPYNLETANYAFDITTRQPHLFVARDVGELIDVLEQFADSMAFRTGGLAGINKGIECRNTCTCQFRSGLQLSGTFVDVRVDSEDNPIYIRTNGPSALAYDSGELDGHGKSYHKDGYSSPIGRLANEDTPLENMTDPQLEVLGIETGKTVRLEFASGIVVEGNLENIVRREGTLILLSFTECTVRHGDEVLFDPDWGRYDMAVGETISSVYCGAADKDAFEQTAIVPRERTIKADSEGKFQNLRSYYQTVRSSRESSEGLEKLKQVWKRVRSEYPDDWLLTLEILEIHHERSVSPDFQANLKSILKKWAVENEGIRKLISDGLKLIVD